MNVRRYWYHENTYYSDEDGTGSGVWVYDIALIKLQEMIWDFMPICLPGINEDYSDNKEIKIFGWGDTTVVGSGNPASILQEIKMKTTTDSDCRKRVFETTSPPFDLSEDELDTMLSALGTEEGPCKGDSGGPYTYINQNRHFLVKLFLI